MDPKLKEELTDKYDATSSDALATLLEVGADASQLEAANETYRRDIKKSLESYTYSSALNLSEPIPPGSTLRLVVIGLTGSGKSATGNTILNNDVFRVSSSAASVTTQESIQRGSWNGYTIEVVDTPGSWNLPTGGFPSYQELYVLVVNLSSPRFERPQLLKLRSLKDREGRNLLKNNLCVLLLTFAREALQRTNLVEYVHDINGDPLEELITKDLEGVRVMAINNIPQTKYERNEQRNKLFSFILGANCRANRERPTTLCPLTTRTKVILAICILVGILIIVLVVVLA